MLMEYRHLEENAKLVLIKNAGHALNLEKPKDFAKHLKSFLIDSPSSSVASKDNPDHDGDGDGDGDQVMI